MKLCWVRQYDRVCHVLYGAGFSVLPSSGSTRGPVRFSGYGEKLTGTGFFSRMGEGGGGVINGGMYMYV